MTYLVGAFICTPIVKYSLDDLKAGGGNVQGKSVVELGTGNTPQDMFVYEKGDRSFILMNNVRNNGNTAPGYPNPYWTTKMEQGILAETERVNEKVPWRIAGKGNAPTTDRAVMVREFDGVMAMDRLGDDRALVLRNDGKGAIKSPCCPCPDKGPTQPGGARVERFRLVRSNMTVSKYPCPMCRAFAPRPR